MEFNFQWDTGNVKHIVDDYPDRNNTIEEVESVFYDKNFIAIPDRIDRFGEQQYHGLGMSSLNTVKYVVFVIRNDEIRPISCRTASRKERSKYDEAVRKKESGH
ncbi:BrnT family toxin [Larkinella terrae]|uniref:BrnT family toxin n=1 Tax=Larkinella terrae TaxID=2025311 RepID=A0A7K0EQ52_9BACT|nr:BrnT family toxin [Larkinella terrae]MRS63606.1 hypothetical protein [Larkinella terrae]